MKRKTFFFLGILIFLSGISHINWIRLDTMIFSWDFPYWFDDFVKDFFPLGFGTWMGFMNF
jgi:hypothetical protein